MLKRRFVLGGVLAASTAVNAYAEIDCTPAKDLVKLAEAFYQADAKYTNIIQPTFSMGLKPIGDFPAPSGIRYLHEDNVIDLRVDADGAVQGLERVLDFNKEGKLCKLVNNQIVEESDEPTAQANMNFKFPFKEAFGFHSVEELREGARDGSKVMNSLAPSGMGFAVPNLKAIAVRPIAETGAIPSLIFSRAGATVDGPVVTQIKETQYFRLKDLKSSKAEALKVSGAYTLFAVFDYDPVEMVKPNSDMDTSKTNAK